MQQWIAFSDHDDNPTHYHIGEVTGIDDNNLIVTNLATTGRNLNTAKWTTLYDVDGELTTQPGRRRQIDEIPLDASDGYVHFYGVQLNTSGTITAASRRKLRATGLLHHVVGTTY